MASIAPPAFGRHHESELGILKGIPKMKTNLSINVRRGHPMRPAGLELQLFSTPFLPCRPLIAYGQATAAPSSRSARHRQRPVYPVLLRALTALGKTSPGVGS